jgi:hypothetical protein
MMTALVSHLMLRADALREKKIELLTPLLAYLIRAEQVYKAYFESTSRDPHDAVNAFDTSPWGLFRGHLLNKATTTVVLGLNSECYDYVLIHKALAHELRSRGKPLAIVKRGSGVMRMSFRHGPCKIVFQDVCAMLATGILLGALAKTVGLTETRFAFPFSSFCDYLFLAVPSLPTARDDWFDSLRGACPPQEVVNKARTEFVENSCATIYDYLTLYLKRDVYQLGRSAALLFGQYQQQFGTHPINSGKSSISSYSSNITNQKKLMRGKHVASYSPTHPLIHAAIRSSCIEGLTCVFQSFEGQPETEETRTDSKAGVMYLDYNSLYASAYALVFFFFQSLLLGSAAGRRRRRKCRPAFEDKLRVALVAAYSVGGGSSSWRRSWREPKSPCRLGARVAGPHRRYFSPLQPAATAGPMAGPRARSSSSSDCSSSDSSRRLFSSFHFFHFQGDSETAVRPVRRLDQERWGVL